MEVEPHRSVFKKEIKVDPKSLIVALGKATLNGAFLNWNGVAEEGIEVLTSLGLETTPAEVAGLLIIRALMGAMEKLLEESAASLVKQPDNLKDLYKELNLSLASGELTIDAGFFQRPRDLKIVAEAQQGFARWLGEFVATETEAQAISRRLPAYFVLALNEEWGKRSADYDVLRNELDTPFTPAMQREQKWLQYRAWLQKQVEEPVFLEAFSLKQVYVPLRAYYEEKEESEEEALARNVKKTKRVVVELKDELETWLQKADKDDAIRLITGGPGSGKSSFAKMFAAQQAEMGEIPVLFIPLHLFKFSGNLIEAVGEFVQVNKFLAENPLKADSSESRLLIIFDGLDELSMQGSVAAETAKQFIDEVRERVNQFNYRELRLQVLISGREVVVQANFNQFRKSHQLLFLLPYFLTEEERKARGETYQYVDAQQLLPADRRQDWWQLYGKAKGKDYSGLPAELARDNLIAITTQPLLNYLIALSFEREELEFTANTNLNEIYADLLKAVYERGYEGTDRQHRAIGNLKKTQFFHILEEIALACWHGNGRTTTVGEIQKHCESSSSVRRILDRFQQELREDDGKASITRLLTAFYFRESGGIRDREKTFEFTHKSFSEYLTAKRIIKTVEVIARKLKKSEEEEDFSEDYDEKQALVTWAKLCGAAALDRDLFYFLWNEMRLQDPEMVRHWQKTLCRLIEFMLRRGMPMEELIPRPNFEEEMRQARNAEEALLAVLNTCARVTRELSEINWPSPEAFGTWIGRLRGQRTSWENGFVLNCLSSLSLKNCVLWNVDLYDVNLRRTNFEGANLTGANLERAELHWANFEGAYLYNVNLEEAYLHEANLEGANLEGANLKGANLEWANLEGVNLRGANLEDVDLEGANLKGANLEWANLERAYLYNANLEGVNFEKTNLKGVMMENLDM